MLVRKTADGGSRARESESETEYHIGGILTIDRGGVWFLRGVCSSVFSTATERILFWVFFNFQKSYEVSPKNVSLFVSPFNQ